MTLLRFLPLQVRALGLACLLLVPVGARAGDSSLEAYGDFGQFAIPAAAAAISVARSDYQGLVQLGATSAITLGITKAIKVTVDRERPNGGGEALPSGHTAAAFMGASYLHYRYGWEWGVPAYAAAAVVGYSRIDADAHDEYDVLAGALIANFTAYVLTDTLNDQVSILPLIDVGKRNFGITGKIFF